MSKARLPCWLGWDLSEYKAFKNIISGIAAIDDMVKGTGVFNTQSTAIAENLLETKVGDLILFGL
jgi:hypothetical protein